MLGNSWKDDPQRLLAYRVNQLLIGERTRFRGATIRRSGRSAYTVRWNGTDRHISGVDAVNYTLDEVWMLVRGKDTEKERAQRVIDKAMAQKRRG